MHNLRYLVCLLLCSQGLHVSGQALFSENFESGALPSNWEVQTLATDGGWRVGNSQSLSSGYFPIQSNNSSFFAGTNDDQCNCNKSNDRLISPSIDLRSVQAAVLSFDAFYIDSDRWIYCNYIDHHLSPQKMRSCCYHREKNQNMF